MKKFFIISIAILSLMFIQAMDNNSPPYKSPELSIESQVSTLNSMINFDKEYKESLRKITGLGAPDSLASLIYEKSTKYGYDPLMVTRLIKAESNFDPNALSPKNALGLMQTLPLTCENLGLEYTTDPIKNIEAGLYILSLMQLEVGGNLELALLYYNGGVKGFRTKFNQLYADNILKS